MVRPAVGSPSSPQEIWDRVMADDAQLPGNWDESAKGAISAIRRGDSPACAFLAARCFKNSGSAAAGVSALSVADEEARNALWLSIVEPLVVDVPSGQERLRVQLDACDEAEWIKCDKVTLDTASTGADRISVLRRGGGILAKGLHGSAENFICGQVVEVSHLVGPERRYTRVVLSKEETLDLRHSLAQPAGSCALKVGSASHRLVYVPGGRFHVLAYPLAGDFSKVLLRPAKRSNASREVLQKMGETLVSQCAKSGHWDLVEMLLRAGMPCPDLQQEFVCLCGQLPQVRRSWSRDLRAARGSQGGSMLRLAAVANTDEPLRRLLSSVQFARDNSPHRSSQPLDLDAPTAEPALPVTLARAGRWDHLKVLLEDMEDETGPLRFMSTEPLFKTTAMLKAPPDVLELARSCAEQAERSGQPCRTLLEYFQRQLSGEVVSSSMEPHHFSLNRGAFVGHSSDADRASNAQCPRVLAHALRFGGVMDSPVVVFIKVSDEEFADVLASVDDATCTSLTIDLNKRRAVRQDPRESGAWLAFLCPSEQWIQGKGRSESWLRVPASCCPNLYIPRASVSVSVLTSCCKSPVPEVSINCCGKRVGITSSDGNLDLALPPGHYTITAPGQSRAEARVRVAAESLEKRPVELLTDGELFIYVQSMSVGVDTSTCSSTSSSVMICACKRHVPGSAQSFVGTASVSGLTRASNQVALRSKAFMPMLTVDANAPCIEALRALEMQCFKHSGVAYEHNADVTEWMAHMSSQGECVMAQLCRMPQRYGSVHTTGARRRGSCPKGELDGTFFTIQAEKAKDTHSLKNSSCFWQTSMLLQSSQWRPMSASAPSLRPASAPTLKSPALAGTCGTPSPSQQSLAATRRRRPASSGGPIPFAGSWRPRSASATLRLQPQRGPRGRLSLMRVCHTSFA